jgi:hypothetical protein
VTDNVIVFPGFRRESPPQSIEEITVRVEQTRKDHINGVLNDLIPELIHTFASYGIDINSDEYIKDVAMVIESIKSMISRQYRVEHPFHKMVNTFFEFSLNEDNSVAYTYKFPTDEE